MIDLPQITQTTAQPFAAIRLTVPRSEIQSVMGPGITEVMAAIKAQSASPTGPWFTHHFRMDPATFDFEICVPIAGPIAVTGRVFCGEKPSLRVARLVYQGPYEGLGAAWGEFGDWIATNKYVAGPDLYECYLAGPESGPDPTQWRTELSRPLIG